MRDEEQVKEQPDVLPQPEQSEQPKSQAEVLPEEAVTAKTEAAKAEGETPLWRRPAAKREAGGLYSKLTISVKTMNWIIGGLVALILLLIFYGVAFGKGYQITFDAQGGTPVETIFLPYGEKIPKVESTRQGYRLKGWSVDREGTRMWDFENNKVEWDYTLYAQWEKDSP